MRRGFLRAEAACRWPPSPRRRRGCRPGIVPGRCRVDPSSTPLPYPRFRPGGMRVRELARGAGVRPGARARTLPGASRTPRRGGARNASEARNTNCRRIGPDVRRVHAPTRPRAPRRGPACVLGRLHLLLSLRSPSWLQTASGRAWSRVVGWLAHPRAPLRGSGPRPRSRLQTIKRSIDKRFIAKSMLLSRYGAPAVASYMTIRRRARRCAEGSVRTDHVRRVRRSSRPPVHDGANRPRSRCQLAASAQETQRIDSGRTSSRTSGMSAPQSTQRP